MDHRIARLLLVVVFLALSCQRSDGSDNKAMSPTIQLTKRLLLLDVDNTLYQESEHGIERQIINNIHAYVQQRLQMSAAEADELHRQYGSTVEGLRQTVWKNLSTAELKTRMHDFYDFVYSTVNVQSLLLKKRGSTTTLDPSTTTGYTHDQQQQQQQHQQQDDRRLLARFWKSCPFPIHVASNSPVRHVQKVLQALGLCTAVTEQRRSLLLTPDADRSSKNDQVPTRSSSFVYPTKHQPTAFFSPLLRPSTTTSSSSSSDNLLLPNEQQQQQQRQHWILLDDSEPALRACTELVGQTVHINNNRSLATALAHAGGWLKNVHYTFAPVDYLQAKNRVDALNRDTWHELGRALRENMSCAWDQQSSQQKEDDLVVVDVGAGLLSMLRWILHGNEDDMPSLMKMLSPQTKVMHYYAYEPNLVLRQACVEQLEAMGFTTTVESTDSLEMIFEKQTTQESSVHVTVHLRFWDYQRPDDDTPTPHLIIGCCFADLVEPHQLASSIVQRFLSSPTTATAAFHHTLLYLPITFCGVTQLVPPQPFGVGPTGLVVPSDTTVFSLYSQALRHEHGHHLDPQLLQEALGDYGAELLSRGRSYWVIDPEQHSYLWETMLYFFGTVVGLDLQEKGWDASGWFDRTRTNRPVICVSNVDLLFRMPHLGHWDASGKTAEEKCVQTSGFYEEIQFVAPGKVTSVKKETDKLETNQVRIDTIASLVSSGTELKIFKGTFDDAALDVNIEGMEDERMAYPLAYGYSLVGRVVECGDEVHDAEDLIGKLVFAFAAHASQVTIDRSSIQKVPDGMNPFDAIFMPSVETALSLVHDARPLLGEQVAVFGQGLIGLLVTAVLANLRLDTPSGLFGTVTTFDTIPERLGASADMGASQALLPCEASKAGPFDIAIEVSGNGRALQSAIDATRDGGRIVIGSWYGNGSVDLCLGIDFHRSRKQLKASQVSTIPPELSMTWTKSRRFALTWEIVRQIRPSRLLTRTSDLSQCQEVYEALETGKEIAVAFEYKRD